MIFRARVVYPGCAPALENGAVHVERGRITKVGAWSERAARSGDVVDLGEVILFPGLVNAHCHLDYTAMAGKISPQKTFADWIKSILALKAHFSYSDYAQSWLQGAKMLLQTGTTAVADIEAVPELLTESLAATPLRVFSFLEMTGVKSGRAAKEIVEEAERVITTLPPAYRTRMGLSPHSPYATNAGLLTASANAGKRISVHVAESKEEWDMFVSRRGPLFDWLKTQRRMEDCGRGTPVECLQAAGLLQEKTVAVHANYVSDGDIALLAKTGTSVVHCPRSHQYFGHARFSYEKMAAAGVNLCLGTDSLASTISKKSQPTSLNMFAEMQRFSEVYPSISPGEVVALATRNGACALGTDKQFGSLAKGLRADFATIPYGGNLKRAGEAIVSHVGPVRASRIDGQFVFGGEGL